MTGAQVLIVEDEESLADLYAEWLADSYRVQTAYTGKEALDRVNEDVEVVLLDRRLPDISGDEVLDAFRDRGLDVPVAMLTAVTPNFDIVTMGFDDYLTKPVSRDQLQQTVANLLARAAATDPLQESFAVQSMQSTLVESVLEDELDRDLLAGEAGPTRDDRKQQRGNGERSGGGTQRSRDGTKRPQSGSEHPRGDVDISQVDTHPLPDVVGDLADEYETRLGYRDRFLLKWLHVVFPLFTLSSVDDGHTDQCRADKTLASMFVMLLDDIGERHHDKATLAEVAKLPFPHETVDRRASGVDVDYLEVTESVWETLDDRLSESPRYDEIEPVLRYDLRQVVHAIRYSVLVNERPELANMTEARALGAHNMMMLAYADIDIAYSSSFELADLGPLRSLLSELQQMARIGNWITTWERELDEGDLSAGVFVAARESGIISADDLRGARDDPAVRERVRTKITEARVEEALLEQWQQRYEQLCEDLPRVPSIDVPELLAGMERVMAYHLASRGLK